MVGGGSGKSVAYSLLAFAEKKTKEIGVRLQEPKHEVWSSFSKEKIGKE